ncbi:MAG: NADH:ubiquinone oxidoreductase [Thermaerobacter sp.]|nr:NADH:ubiquinone oxidoreductase [Thermaerobacter sp.]
MFYWRWINNLAKPVMTSGFPSQADPAVVAGNAVEVADDLRRDPILRRSLAIRHIDTGSCNGCESELQLLASPTYDFSRYGFIYTPSPRHADLLLVTGIVTEAMAPVVGAVFDGMPAPKQVVAVGDCAVSGGVFGGEPRRRLRERVPVMVSITGCPPSPGDVLRALLAAVEEDGQAATGGAGR